MCIIMYVSWKKNWVAQNKKQKKKKKKKMASTYRIKATGMMVLQINKPEKVEQ